MLQKACLLTGENYELLAHETPASKKKVVAMAIAMLIPTLIWGLNGFLLSYQVLRSSFLMAVFTGLALGGIIFIIEKLIIMANGNSGLTLFRICIGAIIALLGSLIIDEVVFNEDIDQQVEKIKGRFISQERSTAAIDYKSQVGYDSLLNGIAAAQLKFDKAEATAVSEADGTTGSENSGIGDITKFKDEKAAGRKSDLESLLLIKKGHDQSLTNVIDAAAKQAEKNFNGHALMIRVKALFEIVASDGYMLVSYILFSLLMFFFEFLVVILKHAWKKTNYERRVEMIEQIGINRINFLMGNSSPLKDPGNYLPQLNNARNDASKDYSMFN